MDAPLKKLILTIIAWSAGFLLLAASSLFLYFKMQFNVYQDDREKFSIEYPKTWKVFVHPQANVAVDFMRPKDTALDTFQDNLNVTIQPVPNDLYNLAAFSARIKTQMTGVFGNTIKIVEDKPIHWGWREGHKFAIEAPNPDHLKMVNAWVIREDQAYILTFVGDLNRYAQEDLIINEMIRSFHLQ